MTKKHLSLLNSWVHGIEIAIFFSFMLAYFKMNESSSEHTEESFWRGLRIAFHYWIDWLTIYHVLYMLGFSLVIGGVIHAIKYFRKRVFGPIK